MLHVNINKPIVETTFEVIIVEMTNLKTWKMLVAVKTGEATNHQIGW